MQYKNRNGIHNLIIATIKINLIRVVVTGFVKTRDIFWMYKITTLQKFKEGIAIMTGNNDCIKYMFPELTSRDKNTHIIYTVDKCLGTYTFTNIHTVADPECARGGGVSHIFPEKGGVSFTLLKK